MQYLKDHTYELLSRELDSQEKQLNNLICEEQNFPKGYLYIRKGKNKNLFYQIIRNRTTDKQINISNNYRLIKQLARKKIHKKLLKVYRNNIRVIQRFLKQYQPLNFQALFPDDLRKIVVEPLQSPTHYERCPFDPLIHIHETVSGIMVRSKSEVIIANALWHYNIPFCYEEIFHTFDGEFFYPDFTIHLPDGSVIIWEHLGMLSKKRYCERTAKKLYYFQNGNFTIGKNLIITQDDLKGNCDSANIYHIIETYIVPHFKDYNL